MFYFSPLLSLALLPCSLTLSLSSSLLLVLPLVRGLFLPGGDQLAGGEKLQLSCAGGFLLVGANPLWASSPNRAGGCSAAGCAACGCWSAAPTSGPGCCPAAAVGCGGPISGSSDWSCGCWSRGGRFLNLGGWVGATFLNLWLSLVLVAQCLTAVICVLDIHNRVWVRVVWGMFLCGLLL